VQGCGNSMRKNASAGSDSENAGRRWAYPQGVPNADMVQVCAPCAPAL
jgi:hypothetical protein